MHRRTTSFAVHRALLCSLFAFGGCAKAIEPAEMEAEDGRAEDSGGSSGLASRGGAGAGGTSLEGNGGWLARGGALSSGGSSSKGGSTGSGGSTEKGGALGASGSTGKAGTQLFFDDFEDGNADGWIPADTYGTWAVTTQDTSLAYVVTPSAKTTSVGGDSSWVDQFIEAKVKVVSTTGSPVIRVLGRWKALKSYLVLEFRPGNATDPEGDLKLRRTLEGGTTDLCRFKPSSALATAWNTIGFSVKGEVATIYFDGMPVVADKECLAGAEPSGGGIALGMEAGTAAFDDIRVSLP